MNLPLYQQSSVETKKNDTFSFAGNTDIQNGNVKLILGLIWSLIAHYQLGASNFPPKKLMLAWLKVMLKNGDDDGGKGSVGDDDDGGVLKNGDDDDGCGADENGDDDGGMGVGD